MNETISAIATWLVPLVIAITFHEVAHGLAANHFGDPTARNLGRLSLNPIRHIDPVGTLLLPMVLAVSGAPVFGWAKPVPVNPSRMRNPRWHGVLTTAAGPGMNYALAIIATALLALLLSPMLDGTPEGAARFIGMNLINFILVNLFLGTFNLLPIPPMDGGHILAGLLPPHIGRHLFAFARYGLFILLILLVVLPMLSPSLNIVAQIIVPPVDWLMRTLLGLFGLA